MCSLVHLPSKSSLRICVIATTPTRNLKSALKVILSVGHELAIFGFGDIRMRPLLPSLVDQLPPPEGERHSGSMIRNVIDTVLAEDGRNRVQRRSVTTAGLDALLKYGMSTGSTRWQYGMTAVSVKLEQEIAQLYPSLQRLHRNCQGKP